MFCTLFVSSILLHFYFPLVELILWSGGDGDDNGHSQLILMRDLLFIRVLVSKFQWGWAPSPQFANPGFNSFKFIIFVSSFLVWGPQEGNSSWGVKFLGSSAFPKNTQNDQYPEVHPTLN